MTYTCHYCDHETENVRYVTFYDQNEERYEPLCEECYQEWLASLKG